ncbi:MAG: hypothetical protein LC118_06605 [Dehalococcoidia bacterium]|nr:hypothetical protein [Dehalococcoidia bacterium]
MYRRILTGIIAQGKTRDFLAAMRESSEHQEERGIRARTAVWGAMTGQTNSVLIASDFNTLDELEKFTELATTDASFAVVRRAVRSQMIYEASNVSIHRLAYHSEGMISSEDATAPRQYMRTLAGDVQPGRHREFVMSISQALEYQKAHGIAATTSVWSAMTGATNAISVVGEFDTLAELEKFDHMAVQDEEFAKLRRGSRESMVFLTSHVQLMRNLL